MPKRPNILYIFTDQQSAPAMSCAGNPDVSTPAMDRLAAEGVRFDRSYCTFPICTPSRASMFTGRYPHQVGITWNEQSMTDEAREHGIGNVLRGAGYDCGYGGKWHIPWCAPMEEGHGFECVNAFDDVNLARDTLAFLRRDRGEQPFFFVASFDNPHNICEVAAGMDLAWGPVPEPARLDDCPVLPANHVPAPYEPRGAVSGRKGDYTPDDWRRYLWTYYRLVEKVDAEIGKILRGLDELGLWDDTLVIFSSDHGDMMGAHQMVQKLPLYDECMHIPLIVRPPGGTSGRCDAEHLVCNGIDLYPTLCDYAGVTPPIALPGASLRPLVEPGTDAPWRDEVVAVTRIGGPRGPQGRMVRTARYKYMAYESGTYREQLFDMERDPGEMVNLAISSRYRTVLQDHRDRLRRWCEAMGDNFGFHYCHSRVPFHIPGDAYAPDSGGVPESEGLYHPPLNRKP